MKKTTPLKVDTSMLMPLFFIILLGVISTPCTVLAEELKLAPGNWYPEVKTKLEQLIS